MKENDVATSTLDCCFAIHRKLGPGLFESVYSGAFQYELQQSGLSFTREEPIDVTYNNVSLGVGFRADFVIERCVIVEVKSVETLAPIHKKQLLNYLRLSDMRLGLLVNFNTLLLKNGMVRLANKL